jgi:hypothetical protein
VCEAIDGDVLGRRGRINDRELWEQMNTCSALLIFHEGVDTGPGSKRGRWIADRVADSLPSVKAGDYLIVKA